MTRSDFCRRFSRKQGEDILVGLEARGRECSGSRRERRGSEDKVLSYSSRRGKWAMGRWLKGRLNIQ